MIHGKIASDTLSARFLTLAQTHVSRLIVRGSKGIGLCCFHEENTSSLSFDFDRGVFHCFGCGKSEGFDASALAVGEPWGTIRHSPRERARFAVHGRRRQAETQARTILEQRAKAQRKALLFRNHEAIREANEAAELLALFHRRLDLAEEFPELVVRTEREYSDALFKQTLLEAQLQGELEVEG